MASNDTKSEEAEAVAEQPSVVVEKKSDVKIVVESSEVEEEEAVDTAPSNGHANGDVVESKKRDRAEADDVEPTLSTTVDEKETKDDDKSDEAEPAKRPKLDDDEADAAADKEEEAEASEPVETEKKSE